MLRGDVGVGIRGAVQELVEQGGVARATKRTRRSRRDEDEPLDHAGPPQGELLGDHAAEREPDEDGTLDADVGQRTANVAGEIADRERPIRGPRPAGAAVVHPEHAEVPEFRQQLVGPEEPGRCPSIQQHDGPGVTWTVVVAVEDLPSSGASPDGRASVLLGVDPLVQ